MHPDHHRLPMDQHGAEYQSAHRIQHGFAQFFRPFGRFRRYHMSVFSDDQCHFHCSPCSGSAKIHVGQADLVVMEVCTVHVHNVVSQMNCGLIGGLEHPIIDLIDSFEDIDMDLQEEQSGMRYSDLTR